MQSYFGSMISTAWPRISSSRLRPNTTSARPPTLATGAHSDAIITMYIEDVLPGVARAADPATLAECRRQHYPRVGAGLLSMLGREGMIGAR